MAGLLWRFLGNFFLYTCLAAVIAVLVSLAGLLRFLPRFLAFLPRLLRVILILSYRLYALLLTPLSQMMEALFTISLDEGFGRLLTCLAFSLLFGRLFLWLFALPLTWWAVGIFLLHGGSVALVWDEIQKPDALQLGERLK